MAIKITPLDDGDLCHGCAWTVNDLDELANEIAHVALGQADHLAEILAAADVEPLESAVEAVDDAIELLTAKGNFAHRDGWMFQVMSWLAAHRTSPGAVISAPHMIHAHKGFDGIQLEVNLVNKTVDAVIIFEDKATEHPRDTIRDSVWPEFEDLEKGKRQNLLIATVSQLLKTVQGINASAAVKKIIWSEARRYRVSITIDKGHNSVSGRARLFKDYNAVVSGSKKRRRGETICINDLRAWMDNLANLTVKKLKAMTHV